MNKHSFNRRFVAILFCPDQGVERIYLRENRLALALCKFDSNIAWKGARRYLSSRGGLHSLGYKPFDA